MSGSRQKKVVILGGGACGMSAALELSRHGASAIVVEREGRVGGLCGTHERDGFRFDFGGHRFITQNGAVDSLVRALVGDDLLERRRQSVVLNGGRRYRYPLELDDVVRQYGPVRSVRALASYLGEAVRQGVASRPDDSFEAWVTHRFGSELYRTFFGPYTAKLWGLSPEQISADWASQRISLPSLWDVALRLLGVPRPQARTYARNYRYPRRGIGQIFERFGQEIEKLGGEVRTEAEVVGLVVRRGRVRAVRFRDPRGEHEIACDAVISTLSLPALAGMLGKAAAEVERSAGRLRFRAIRLLNLMLEGGPVSSNTWMYVSEPQYLMARIQEPIQRSPEMAPPGRTSLMLEIPCAVGDGIWEAPDGALYERCLIDLQQLGFDDLRARTLGYFSAYVREGYPIYHLGYDEDRRRVLGHIGGFEGLISCGRQGAFRYIFMDTAMEMGLEAARAVLAGRSAAHVAELGADPRLHEARATTA
ncbi:MAG: FAD-dependent oxidoreductase [Myxococcales bacterium]